MADFPENHEDKSPFVCVDLSGVDSNDPEELRQLIDRCAEADVEAVNLPLYRTDHLVSLVHREDEAEEYREHELDRDAFSELSSHARDRELETSATVFDPELLAWYETNTETPYVRFHGGDITYRRLLEATSETSRTPVVSTAAANADDIHRALDWLDHDSPVLLHEPVGSSLNLDRLRWLSDTFDKSVGLLQDVTDVEDLTTIPVTDLAVWMPRLSGSVETSVSALETLRNHLDEEHTDREGTLHANSKTSDGPSLPTDETEAYRSRYRRSLMASESLSAGETLQLEQVREMRPAGGLPAEQIRACNGMMVTRPTDPQEMIAY